MAHGGEAVGRLDGKACFVYGAMPGETVAIRVTDDRGSWARATLDRVLVASGDRIEPPCRHFDECGGCDWQFARYENQLEWKRGVVAGQLRHLGRIDAPPVRETAAPGPPFAYRNRMDFFVAGGRPALRARRSHEAVPIAHCLVGAPAIDEMFRNLPDLGRAQRVILRCGVNTGDRLMIVHGTAPPGMDDLDVRIATTDGRRLRALRGEPFLTEQVAGVTFRITGTAFFQVNTAGAEGLVRFVAEALGERRTGSILDAYAGGGLFSLTAGAAGRVTAVESSGLAVSDLEANVAAAGAAVEIRRGRVETTIGNLGPFDAVIVDPPRRGLARDGVDAIVATDAPIIAYVSCDPASLGRDAALLTSAGYTLDWAQPVDLFPQTHHVETVARFVRGR